MAEPENRFKLNPTRIFLIVMLVVALALSATSIVASLNGWQREDAAATTPTS